MCAFIPNVEKCADNARFWPNLWSKIYFVVVLHQIQQYRSVILSFIAAEANCHGPLPRPE